jgi:hypothetical protein
MYLQPTNEDFKAISEIVGSEMNFIMKLENSFCVDVEYNQYIEDVEPVTYCIKNTFNEKELSDLQKHPHWITVKDPDIIYHPSTDIDNLNNSDNNPVFNYIYPLIKKMRLLKEGNICMPFLYFYVSSRKSPILISGLEYGSYVVPEQYTLEICEFRNIQNIEIPFTYDFLQFAFENFELSYEIQNKNLQFLTLMNGMEALFNKGGGGEILYKLSRNVAVLLGGDYENSELIETRMKKLYGIRSNIVHKGKEEISENELSDLRKYLRQSIIRFNKLNQDKNFIFDLLSRRGFGDSPINNINPILNPYFSENQI